jgi:hypothetical protein
MEALELRLVRFEYERVRGAYVRAEFQLLAKLERATNGRGPFPSPAEYEAAESLGRDAGAALEGLLRASGVAGKRARRRRLDDRVSLIQRLSAEERSWQPSPEEWLRSQSLSG